MSRSELVSGMPLERFGFKLPRLHEYEQSGVLRR
jgi:hypothetical protein